MLAYIPYMDPMGLMNWICPESSISPASRNVISSWPFQRQAAKMVRIGGIFFPGCRTRHGDRSILLLDPHFWTVAVAYIFWGTSPDVPWKKHWQMTINIHQLIGSIMLNCITEVHLFAQKDVTSYSWAGSVRRLMGWIDRMFHVVWDTLWLCQNSAIENWVFP